MSEHKDTLKVLITGFGAFNDHETNPSFEVVKGLPRSIFVGSRRLELVVHPEPVKVAYRTVRKLLPELYAQHESIDLVIHLGLDELSQGEYSLEKLARKKGYDSKDVDGIIGDQVNFEAGWEDWGDGPDDLKTSIEVEKVIENLKDKLESDVKIRSSNDAGHYLCEYIYYGSLFHFSSVLKKSRLPVTFLHVPASVEARAIERGRRILLEVIGSIVLLGFA
ncbi:hypothetical protein O181_039218 [Austropuccinia psidii MF-1]|uniref:Pyroglutamyl-peptidase I n=1 Tax=Austropuccinia psidii MF-1 TaxID=1389203 RepID=A0A9Q3DCZ0_9BASI|nr:hypothetical protein [Austropuccinia psidii MF-1]